MIQSRSTVEILDVWGSIEPRFGGVGPAASSLASAVHRLSGMQNRQIAICHSSESKRADGIDPNVIKLNSASMRGWSDLNLIRGLRQAVVAADICHVHGLWMPHCLAVRHLSDEMRKPIVSSVHGMLERWEMRNKPLKKALYSWLFERPSLSRSACLRALTLREVDDYRRFGVRRPIALVPNGINPLKRIDTAELLNNFPELSGKAIVLFLGRVHHKKGVLNLVQSWKSVARRCPAAHLVIAGPEYADTGVKVRQLIMELGVGSSVTILGVISGKTKVAALSIAKYFCLPSYSEGLSVAVLEALSLGLPVIVTPECNIDEIISCGAGFSSSNEPLALAETLVSCLGASSSEWENMSLAAAKLARSQFDWNKTAITMYSVYEWLLGGDRPACLIT